MANNISSTTRRAGASRSKRAKKMRLNRLKLCTAEIEETLMLITRDELMVSRSKLTHTSAFCEYGLEPKNIVTSTAQRLSHYMANRVSEKR